MTDMPQSIPRTGAGASAGWTARHPLVQCGLVLALLLGLILALLVGMGSVVAQLHYLDLKSEARSRAIVRAQGEYCASRGFQTYTSHGPKCVDRDGNEKVIPDRVWTDAGIE